MGKRILVVEDSSVMRKIIAETLEGEGHQIVGTAKNGEEAVSLYLLHKPDLITMDVTMKGMDGLSAARAILKIDGAARIIFLSNLIDEKLREEALRLGAKGFINKNDPSRIIEYVKCF